MPQPPREIGTRQRGSRALGGGFVKAPFSFFLPGGECAGDLLSWWLSSGERRLQLDAPWSRKIYHTSVYYLGAYHTRSQLLVFFPALFWPLDSRGTATGDRLSQFPSPGHTNYYPPILRSLRAFLRSTACLHNTVDLRIHES